MRATDSITDSTADRIPALISTLIDGAVANMDADLPASRDYLRRALAILRARETVLQALPGGVESPRPVGLARWQVKKLLTYIDENLAEKITAGELAQEINVSIGTLCRGFKVTFAVSPLRFVVLRRVEFAANLLRTTRQPLSEVAFASGFCDQAHFCRAFRRVTGSKPSMWRRARTDEPTSQVLHDGTGQSSNGVPGLLPQTLSSASAPAPRDM
jgi:AraC family transcriptional regulator